MISTITTNQLRSLWRQGVVKASGATLLLMTALAGLLGWSSRNTITRVYSQAIELLASDGRQPPPNPFALKPELSLLSNMVVYIPLIGALLAIVVGHLGIVDDEAEGIGRLLFSRRLSPVSYVLGKISAAGAVLGAVLAGSLAISTFSLLVVNRAIGPGDFSRLVVFYGLSWLYLLAFTLVGMATALLTRHRSLSLLSAMGIWLVVTFVVPQFTSGLRPTASLNPVTNPVSTSQAFFRFTANLRPYSIVEQYTAASGRILRTAPDESSWTTLVRVFPTAGMVVILVFATLALTRRHDFSRSAAND